MERRLTAILAADVVGYSRLMEADEEATVRALHACREVIDGLVSEHGGRVFGSAGDSVVAEFPSPVEAVRCAVDIQRALEACNAALPEDRRMRLRIGVNLGDVIAEGDDLLGDGVNIAARLETLADPGGIYLSRPVFDQIRKHLDLGYEYLGEQAVKNIAEPVGIYRALTEPAVAGKVIDGTKGRHRVRNRLVFAAAAAVLVLAAAAAIWLRPWQPAVEPASVERMALPLPDKPSIAVLPFVNLSGDVDQGYVADGITEDITTALSQISSLFVIAGNSAFTYRGRAVTARQVAEELGVRYVLEGSVQRGGERLRISAQLIDALDGVYVWAERYDRKATELFTLQDEITNRIVVALRIKLTAGEVARVHHRHTRSLQAWNQFSRGLEHMYRSTRPGNAAARQWFEKAIATDREYALAYAFLAWTHWLDVFHGWSANPRVSFERAAFLAEKAQALDDALPDVHALQGAIHMIRREFDQAIEAAEKAIALSPNHATNMAFLAMVQHYADRPEEAIRTYKAAMRLSPYYPAWFLEDLGFSYLEAGQPAEALIAFEKFLERGPAAIHVAHAHIGRALAYHALDQDDAARSEVAKAVAADARISLAAMRQIALNRDRARVERGLAILRVLGLPE